MKNIFSIMRDLVYSWTSGKMLGLFLGEKNVSIQEVDINRSLRESDKRVTKVSGLGMLTGELHASYDMQFLFFIFYFCMQISLFL